MNQTATLAASYLRTLALGKRFRDRMAFEGWQAKRIEEFLDRAAGSTRFYGGLRGRPLAELPVTHKAMMLKDFAAFNTLGLEAAEAWRVIESGIARPGYEIGSSTGTTGLRGLYVISEVERFRWLGVMLAKALPGVLWRRERVAVLLPGPSPLYQSANQSRLLRLLALDPRAGPECLVAPLEAFRPTVIVAAPKTLRWLGERGADLSPRQVFAAAEVLDPPDRAIITRSFGLKPKQVYMATEGLFAVSCRHGTLHLAEDCVHFELEPLAGTDNLVTPLVTSFMRQTQILARYRLGDILRLHDTPCPCGSIYRAVSVEGRYEDIFTLKGRDAAVRLTPGDLTRAILKSDTPIDDFRLYRLDEANVRLVLPQTIPAPHVEAARKALDAFLHESSADVTVQLVQDNLMPPFGHKLRRVMAHPPSVTS